MSTEPAMNPQITQLLGPLLTNHERIERYRAIAIKLASGGRVRTARSATPRASAFQELHTWMLASRTGISPNTTDFCSSTLTLVVIF
jgi:hypothetical protein